MRTTDAHQDLPVRPVNWDWTASLANQGHLVSPAYLVLTHRFHCHPMDVVVGVHQDPPDLQAHQAQLDHPETKVNQETQAHRPRMALPAVQEVPEAQANQANKAIQVQQATLEGQPKLDKKATMVHPVVQANPVQEAPTPKEEAPENQEVQDPTVPQATPALQANQETKAPQAAKVRTEAPAKMPNIVLVPDEERLRKRKPRKPKKDTIWNFILLFAIFNSSFLR
jgi:hypothetical protein